MNLTAAFVTVRGWSLAENHRKLRFFFPFYLDFLLFPRQMKRLWGETFWLFKGTNETRQGKNGLDGPGEYENSGCEMLGGNTTLPVFA